MSEYVFPRSYSYTEGSGSGSGSGGETFVNCTDCGLPPGTSLDTHYLNTSALVSSYAVGSEACCPAVARETTKECTDCGLPPGYSIDDYYVDINHLVPIDATGQSECCPAVSRNNTKPCFPCPVEYDPLTHYIETTGVVPVEAEGIYACCSVLPLNNQLFPCSYRPLPEGYDPLYFYVDANSTNLVPGIPCPVKPYDYDPNDCDPACDEAQGFYCLNGQCVESPNPPSGQPCLPSCSGCQGCVDGECVDLPRSPCEIYQYTLPDGSTSIFAPGTSSDTHFVDTSETKCILDADKRCPLVLRDDPEDPNQTTTTINVPKGQIVASIPAPCIRKTGEGTLVIVPPSAGVLPRPMCKTVIIEEGEIILHDKDGFDSPTVCFGFPRSGNSSNKLTLNIGTNICSIGNIQFGLKNDVSSSSYTAGESVYTGVIDIGLGGIVINNIPSLNEIRSLLIAGRNEGEWDGSYGFVTSKNVNGVKNIGYNYNAEDNSVLIKWAASGDTNLDGVVDILDVANILSSGKYDSGTSDGQWIDGDFNYDGLIDILDIALFLSANNFDQGNYLPQDTSFKILFTPPREVVGETTILNLWNEYFTPISVSTETASILKDGIRVYSPSFKDSRNQEWSMFCQTKTKSQCESSPWSYFSVQSTCHDSACNIQVVKDQAQIK